MKKIMTKNELDALREEYFDIDTEIANLERRKREIDNAISKNACQEAENRFGEFEIGDKIRVTRTTGVVEGFFGGIALPSNGLAYHDTVWHMVRLELRQVKKDGTMSKKKDILSFRYVKNIEKITE